MSNPRETEWGFPKDRVAQTLRQILNRDLTSQEVEAISVVLFSHLLIEDHLNKIFYKLLVADLPRTPSGATESEQLTARAQDKEMEGQVWQKVANTQFIRKLEYIEPGLKKCFPHLSNRIRSINQVRNGIFHGRRMDETLFDGYSICSEEGIEKYFLRAQFASQELDKFYEVIDFPHANAERWAKRLSELGEPLI